MECVVSENPFCKGFIGDCSIMESYRERRGDRQIKEGEWDR